MNRFGFFVGIDWGSDEHEVRVVDRDGTQVLDRRVKHRAAAFRELIAELSRLSSGDFSAIVVGIEVNDGLVVETMLEHNIAVYALNPKQTDRFRDRYSGAGAKDDPLDAYVIADTLRNDLHLYRRVELDPEKIVELRGLSREREALLRDGIALSNQIRATLIDYVPEVLALDPGCEHRWFLELLGKAPTIKQMRRMTHKQLAGHLKVRRIRKTSADEVKAALRGETIPFAPGVSAARARTLKHLVQRRLLVLQQMTETDKELRRLVDDLTEDEDSAEQFEHRDAAIIQSLPGAGFRVTATMLAEASAAIRRRDYQALRTKAGAAAVTKKTGKQKNRSKTRKRGPKPRIIMRRACSKRLRNACHHWAANAVLHNPRCKEIYARHRAKEQTHGRALRSVADHLMRVLIACLRDGELFDVERHVQRPHSVAA